MNTQPKKFLSTLLCASIMLLCCSSVLGLNYTIKSSLNDRSTLNDKHYYLDSIITFAEPSSTGFFEAHLLKSNLLSRQKQNVEALGYLKKVIENEHSSLHPELLGQSYMSLADLYANDKSHNLAQDYLTEAFIIFDSLGKEDQKAVVLVKSANIYKTEKKFSIALRHYKQAHDIYLAQGKLIQSVELSEEIGKTAYQAGEFIEAEDYLNKALNGFEQTKDTLEQIKILNTLADIYGYEENLQLKLQTEKRLCELSEIYENSSKTALYFAQLASTYGATGNNREALKTQEKAISFFSGLEIDDLFENLIKLSELYTVNARETDAILTLHKANSLAISADAPDKIINSSQVIADFYKERGEWQKALEYLSISDSISRALLQTKIRKLERGNEAEANALVPVVKGQNEEEDSTAISTAFKNTIIALAAAVLIIIGFLIFYLRRRKKIRRILEWKVYKRTKELRNVNAELNTYIYKSSHDLRNPLTSIKSLITLLKTETDTNQLAKYTKLIEDCANQMDEILLNLSRAVDYKKVEPEVVQIDFEDVKNSLDLASLLPEGQKIDISWNVREKAPFYSDPTFLNVILKKTILNSIQYRIGSSTDYCRVTITTDSSGASVSVEDNGQGIPEKVKDSVFDMFVKGTHKSKGAGLGLYLVKIATNKLRGKITLESQENRGSKLVFKLPNLA